MSAVIYAIWNIIDDKCYIGQTTDKEFRWKEHKKQLKGFYHHSILLQRAWCKHGEESFIFIVLESLNDISVLNNREIYWGKLLNPEYNVAPLGGSMRGYKHTAGAKLNMRNSHLGKKHHSEEEKLKRSERMKGNAFNLGRKQSAEHIEARAKVHRGKITSEETKLKMSLSQKGRKLTDEHRAKLSAAKRGKQLSDDHKQKLSDAAKKQWESSLTNQQFKIYSDVKF